MWSLNATLQGVGARGRWLIVITHVVTAVRHTQQAAPVWKYRPLNEHNANGRECVQKVVSCSVVFRRAVHAESEASVYRALVKSSSTSSFYLLRGRSRFSCSFHCMLQFFFGILWLCIVSTWLYHLTRRDFINVTISSLVICPLAPFSHSSAFSFFNRSSCFSWNFPFKYSERVFLFRGHCSSIWPHRSVRVLL